MPTSLVIHGHFYQPPRENPWTEVVEPEPSAAPFHDWNERIYQECYRSNGNARIMLASGHVEAIVNNYLQLSFNFGPTLLSWMDKEHPHGIKRIADADRESGKIRGGHGNAIAQAYNHCILTLCNDHDLRTQIKWGLAEFKFRFGREAESLWLPETACNDRVLEALADAGIKWVILAPAQCLRVRPLGSEDWESKEHADVDPGRAYRWTQGGSAKKSLALFYDGPMSRSMAFGEGLKSSQDLVAVLSRAGQGEGRLVSVATDGESYGHHTKWGDRTLAYALLNEAAKAGFETTNFGAYLEKHPPKWDAEVKPGPEGEGTSWSCAHGTGRWSRDCGCSTGGEPGWNQQWRGPLRAALDYLRDYAAAFFKKEASKFFKDPWAARDAFIELLLDPTEASRGRFIAAHASRKLLPHEAVRALRLLDLQRHAMLMYTSCGWFFCELSGIETLQVLKYACRVMDELSGLGEAPPRREFLNLLSVAKSNIEALGNGADIFRKMVEPSKVTPERLAAHLAVSSLVEEGEQGDFGAWRYSFDSRSRESLGKTALVTARVKLVNRITGADFEAMVAAAHLGGIDFHANVGKWEGEAALRESSERVMKEFMKGLIPPLIKAMREEFGVREFGLHDLLPGHRERLASLVFGQIVQDLSENLSRAWAENRRYLEMFQAAGFPMPRELKTAAEFALTRQFEEEIKTSRQSPDPDAWKRAVEIVETATRLGYHIDRSLADRLFGEMITEAVKLAMESPDSSHLERAIALLGLTRRLGLSPNLDRAQEFAILAADLLHAPESLEKLAELLWLDRSLLIKASPSQ